MKIVPASELIMLLTVQPISHMKLIAKAPT